MSLRRRAGRWGRFPVRRRTSCAARIGGRRCASCSGRTEVLDGWVVLQPAAHLATKVAALVDRPDSAPGDKDRHEIMALLSQGIDTAEAVAVIHEASVRPPHEVTALIDQSFAYLGDLRLDRNQRRSLNHLARQWHDHSQRLAPDPPPPPSRRSPGRTGPERRSPGLEM